MAKAKEKEVIFYPDGSIHVTVEGKDKPIHKAYRGYVPDLQVIESAKVKVDKTTIIIHADSVEFEGAGLHKLLEAMAKELCRQKDMINRLGKKTTWMEKGLDNHYRYHESLNNNHGET